LKNEFLFRDLRRWINQERGINSSSNGDSDNANEYIKRREHGHLHHHHYPSQQQQQQRRRTAAYHTGSSTHTRQPTILQKLFGVDHQTSSFSKLKSSSFVFFFIVTFLVRDHTSNYNQGKNSSKIIANLTTVNHSPDEQQTNLSPQKLQTQLSVQDTIQRHFCQILKNDSLTVTDNTTLTETILMRENSSSNPPILSRLIKRNQKQIRTFQLLDTTQLTPPMSNDDENKRPTSNKTRSNLNEQKDKKSSNTNQVQYRILQRGQPDESTSNTKKSQLPTEINRIENSTNGKSQRNRRKFFFFFGFSHRKYVFNRTVRSTFK